MNNEFTPKGSIEKRAAVGGVPGGIVVNVTWTWSGGPLDRPYTGGWYVPNMKLAERLVRAIDAGVVHVERTLARDINGATYVAARALVLGRYLNADLKRLGF